MNLETFIDMQSLCRTWPLNGLNHTRVKPKLVRRREGVYDSFSSCRKDQKSFITTIPFLAKPVKNYHGIIGHQLLTVLRRMVLLRERYSGLKKGLLPYGCNRVRMKSDGRIPRNVIPICEVITLCERRFGTVQTSHNSFWKNCRVSSEFCRPVKTPPLGMCITRRESDRRELHFIVITSNPELSCALGRIIPNTTAMFRRDQGSKYLGRVAGKTKR